MFSQKASAVILTVACCASTTASAQEPPAIEELQGLSIIMQIHYVNTRYEGYFNTLYGLHSQIGKSSEIQASSDSFMEPVATARIESLMYIYNTEAFLFSLLPLADEEEMTSFLDNIKEHNASDRESLTHIRQYFQLFSTAGETYEFRDCASDVLEIIDDSLELLTMVDHLCDDLEAHFDQTHQ